MFVTNFWTIFLRKGKRWACKMEKQDNIIKVNSWQLRHEIGFLITAFNTELHNSDEDVTMTRTMCNKTVVAVSRHYHKHLPGGQPEKCQDNSKLHIFKPQTLQIQMQYCHTNIQRKLPVLPQPSVKSRRVLQQPSRAVTMEGGGGEHILTHWGRGTQICVFCIFALQLQKTNDANLRF
jgi:hypothetical protein